MDVADPRAHRDISLIGIPLQHAQPHPAQIAIPGKLVLDNSEVFTAAGLAGLGMLQGMRFFLQPYIDSGQLVEILPDFPAPRRPLSLLYPHRHLSHKVRVFADWLQGLVATLD